VGSTGKLLIVSMASIKGSAVVRLALGDVTTARKSRAAYDRSAHHPIKPIACLPATQNITQLSTYQFLSSFIIRTKIASHPRKARLLLQTASES
jgi:hypothetical protein